MRASCTHSVKISTCVSVWTIRYNEGMISEGIIGGDAKSFSIAAASILAKTARDARMVELDATYPGYGFASHKGYRAPVHARALLELGPCEIHRMSWGPVRLALLGKDPLLAYDDAIQDELPLGL